MTRKYLFRCFKHQSVHLKRSNKLSCAILRFLNMKSQVKSWGKLWIPHRCPTGLVDNKCEKWTELPGGTFKFQSNVTQKCKPFFNFKVSRIQSFWHSTRTWLRTFERTAWQLYTVRIHVQCAVTKSTPNWIREINGGTHQLVNRDANTHIKTV